MDVKIGPLQPVGVDGEKFGVRPQVAHRRLRALPHRLAEEPGEGQAPFAGHSGRFNEQNFAAGRRPGEAGGHAGDARAVGRLAEIAGRPQQFGDHRQSDGHELLPPFRVLTRDLAADRRDLSLKVAQAGFAGVVGDHFLDRAGADDQVFRGQAVGVKLLGDDVFLGDQRLLFFAVAGKMQDLHPVEQGGGDRLQDVGGRDEHDLREVEIDIQIIVPEGGILLGVKHFQERRGGVSAKVAAELVHLVEHEHGIVRPGFANPLDDPAGQRGDVGAAMAADLGLVVDAAQADAHELPPQGPGDALAQRGLPRPRRAGEAEDWPLHVFLELAHREIFEDPLFDFFQVVVVVVEHLAGASEVETVAAGLRPGQDGQPVEIRPDDRILGRAGVHPAQSFDLPLGFGQNVLGRLGLFETPPEFFQFGVLGLAFAEFFLNGFDLLAEEMVALRLGDFGTDLFLNLARQLQDGDLPREELAELFEARADVDFAEELLLFLDAERQAGAEQVGEPSGLARVHRGDLKFLGHLLTLIDHLLEEPTDVMHLGVEFDPLLNDLLQRFQPSGEEGLLADDLNDPGARGSLRDDSRRAVGELEHLEHDADANRRIEVVAGGLVSLGTLLSDHPEELFTAQDFVEESNPARPVDDQRDDRLGKDDVGAQRQQRHEVGQGVRAVGAVREHQRAAGGVVVAAAVHDRRIGRRARHALLGPSTLASLGLGSHENRG